MSQWFAKITSHICHFIEEKKYHTYLKEHQSQDFIIIIFLSLKYLNKIRINFHICTWEKTS